MKQWELDARGARRRRHFRQVRAVREQSISIKSEPLTRIFIPVLVDPFERGFILWIGSRLGGGGDVRSVGLLIFQLRAQFGQFIGV